MADTKQLVECGFFDAINEDRTYSADDMNHPYERLVSNGVFATPEGTASTDFKVSASGSRVTVEAGAGIFADKWFKSAAAISFTVPENTSLTPRIDSVIAQVDKRTSGRNGSIVYRTGTPAGNPAAPSINTVANVIEYRIANVRVNASSGTVTAAGITDMRGTSECPWVTALIKQVDTTELFEQYQAAMSDYETSFENWTQAEKESWSDFKASLSGELTASTSVITLTNTVSVTEATASVDIGIALFDPSTDVLQVYLNGLLLSPDTEYTVADNAGTKSINLTNALEASEVANVFTFIVFKSLVSGNLDSINSLVRKVENLVAIGYSTPLVAETADAMTDTNKIYVYTGNESGYTFGNWYYYNGTAWASGGAYNSTAVTTDITLTASGVPADAKATGDAIQELADDLSAATTALGGDIADLKDDLNTFTGFEKIVFTSGGYINTSGNTVDVNTVVANSLYRYAVVDCSEGDEFTITGLGGSNPRLWCFINSVGDVLSKAYDTESRTDYVLTAPENSAKLIINDRSNGASYKGVHYTMSDVETELNAKIDKTDADLADLADITTTVDWDSVTATVQTGTAYNTDSTSGIAWSNANSYIYTVVPGGVYRVSTTVIANAKYYGVLFYDGTTYLSGEVQGIVGTQQAITNHEFSAPLNANKAVITTYSSVIPSLVQKTLKPYIDDSVGAIAPNYVKYDGTTLTVKCRYNTSEDLVVQMKKRGNNELFDFDRIFTVDRTNLLDGNVSSIRNILTANTDCFSPHQIKAVNSADGDSTDIFLTGGNHNHNGVATAVCQNVKVYVDGEEVTDVSRLAGEVVVTWQNLIQAYNTWKSDGSGRAVLQENIRLEIHGNTFNAIVEQTALEDIDQSVYYGLQSIDTPYQTIVFVGGDDRTEGAISASRNSGNLTSRRTIAKNSTTGDALETYVDDIDLGSFDYTGETFSIFTANNKCYYAVLRSRTIRMSSGANYYLYGGYKFYSLA